MKEILIKAQIEEGKIATGIKHSGFSDSGYTIEQILITIGICENIKAQMLQKLEEKGRIAKG